MSAIARNLGIPARTLHLLQGESLLNDASGLVAPKVAAAATLTGVFSWADAAREFLLVALGGLGLGTLIGWGFAVTREAVTRRVGDVASTQMVLLLVLLPFAAYLLAERFGVAGILATVAAGVTTNFADLRRGAFIVGHLRAEGSWTMVESAFNCAVFLLLGLQLPSIVGGALQAAGHAS